jgi:hypothetical protein
MEFEGEKKLSSAQHPAGRAFQFDKLAPRALEKNNQIVNGRPLATRGRVFGIVCHWEEQIAAYEKYGGGGPQVSGSRG